MGISNSWFSYKIMLPFYLFVLSYISIDSEIITYFFIMIISFLMYVLFRRSIKIKKTDIILIICCLVAGLLISAIVKEIIPSGTLVPIVK